ncbi:MAG: chemotaxis protein CheC [Bacteroidota bacterium]|jgi:chemotaxis protein CheC
MKELTKEQEDSLGELINIGVGRAANALNELTGSHIVLRVPRIELYNFEELEEIQNRFGKDQLAAVWQNFRGGYEGRAALIFPTDSALSLVEGITGEEPEAEDLDAIQSGTLCEIGNIVINALLGTIGNILGDRLDFDLSEYQQDQIENLLSVDKNSTNEGLILLSEVHFLIEKLDISGHIILTFDIDNLKTLFKLVDQVFEE